MLFTTADRHQYFRETCCKVLQIKPPHFIKILVFIYETICWNVTFQISHTCVVKDSGLLGNNIASLDLCFLMLGRYMRLHFQSLKRCPRIFIFDQCSPCKTLSVTSQKNLNTLYHITFQKAIIFDFFTCNKIDCSAHENPK